MLTVHRALRTWAEKSQGLESLGAQSPERVLAMMKDAGALLFPSRCYEGFPLVAAKAYPVGLPVIAGDHGSLSSLIDHGRTGLRFSSGDPAALAATVTWLWTHPEEQRPCAAARRTLEQEYTVERNYHALMDIYALATRRALASRARHAPTGWPAPDRRFQRAPTRDVPAERGGAWSAP